MRSQFSKVCALKFANFISDNWSEVTYKSILLSLRSVPLVKKVRTIFAWCSFLFRKNIEDGGPHLESKWSQSSVAMHYFSHAMHTTRFKTMFMMKRNTNLYCYHFFLFHLWKKVRTIFVWCIILFRTFLENIEDGGPHLEFTWSQSSIAMHYSIHAKHTTHLKTMFVLQKTQHQSLLRTKHCCGSNQLVR